MLFAERAETSAPGITFDGPSSDAIVDICVRLDGLPLAIELAAARVRALNVTQIASRLDDRFRLLSSGSRVLMPHQRTLRAVVDWSYDLLEAGERLLFQRLSIFASAASLDSVETVCSGDGIDPDDVAPLLSPWSTCRSSLWGPAPAETASRCSTRSRTTPPRSWPPPATPTPSAGSTPTG